MINIINGSSNEIERPFSGNSSTFISLGSKLAEIIGGVSRNAVIGKAHRLNLSAKIKTRSIVKMSKA